MKKVVFFILIKAKRFLQKYWKDGIFVIVCIFCILYAYRDLPYVYFMHDEWRAQAQVFLYGLSSWVYLFTPLQLLLGLDRSRLLGALSNSIVYNYFPMQTFVFITIAFLLHIANSVLLYAVVKKFEKNIHHIAAIIALIFATSSTGQQTLSWIGAEFQILFCILFCFLSLNSMIEYLKSKRTFLLVTSLFFMYIAYLFKEIALTQLIGYLMFFWWRYYQSIKRSVNKKRFLRICVIFGLVSVLFLFKKLSYLATAIPNLVYYPLVSLSQTIIPYRYMYRLSSWFFQHFYPSISGYNDAATINYFIVADIVSILLSLCIGISIFFAYRITRYKKILGFSLIFYILTFIPIGVALNTRNASYIDSRHMYMPMIAASFIFGILIEAIFQFINKYFRNRRLTIFIFIVIFSCLIYKQCNITQREVRESAISGRQMISFMTQYTNIRKQIEIPDKPVFYFQSDRNYYYEGNKLPFLLGAGFVLGVIEYPSGKIPKPILQNEILGDFGSQGYFEYVDKGYGYYYDIEILRKDILKRKLKPDQIVGFRYNSENNLLTNITDELKDMIRR